MRPISVKQKQSYRKWDVNNPLEIKEHLIHTKKSYFFASNFGHGITVNGECFQLFWPELEVMDRNDTWFKLGSTAWHTIHATLDILKE